MKEETCSRRGWGGGVHFKNCYYQGGGSIIFICNYFGVGGKVLIHHNFLKTHASL